jgi:hypothetical protein
MGKSNVWLHGQGRGDVDMMGKQAHRLQSLLVVRTTSAHVYANLMVNQGRGAVIFPESMDNALESRCNVGKVSDTTTDDEDLALRMWLATSDQIDCE